MQIARSVRWLSRQQSLQSHLTVAADLHGLPLTPLQFSDKLELDVELRRRIRNMAQYVGIARVDGAVSIALQNVGPEPGGIERPHRWPRRYALRRARLSRDLDGVADHVGDRVGELFDHGLVDLGVLAGRDQTDLFGDHVGDFAHQARHALEHGLAVGSRQVHARQPHVNDLDTEGARLTGGTIRNKVLSAANDDIVESVRSGGSLSGAMRTSGVFPPLLVYLTASGESAGQLDTMLERAAEYLEREFDNFTSTALSLLEPLIIVAMGGVVAVIILAILLPILQLQNLTGL